MSSKNISLNNNLNNNLRILKIFLFITIILASTIMISKQVRADGCCVTVTQCLDATSIDQASCEVNGGVWNSTTNCTDILNCHQGCCCEDQNGGTITTKWACDNMGYSFNASSTTNCGPEQCGGAVANKKEKYNITGYLKYPNGTIIKGEQIAVSLNDFFYHSIVHPSTDGYFSFENVTGGFEQFYSIDAEYTNATGAKCTGSAHWHTLTNNWKVNITLTCAGQTVLPPSQDCTVHWIADWTGGQKQTAKGCGRPYNIQIIDVVGAGCAAMGCDEDHMNKCPQKDKPVYTDCGGENLCGDSNIDYDVGEVCDPPGSNIGSCSVFDSRYSSGKVKCGADCHHYDYSECVEECPSPNEAEDKCTDSITCKNCQQVCSQVPFCQGPQDCYKAPQLTLNPVLGINDLLVNIKLDLDVNSPCYINLKKIELIRCEGNNDNKCKNAGTPTIFDFPGDFPSGALNSLKTSGAQYIDSGLEPNTKYCYEVKAIYTDPVTGQAIMKTSKDLANGDLTCKATGDPECLQTCQQHEENSNNYITGKGPCTNPSPEPVKTKFCDNTVNPAKIKSCNDQNSLAESRECPTGQDCIGPGPDGDARCSQDTLCDNCNSVYGVFWNLGLGGLKIPKDADGTQYINCKDKEVIKYPFNPGSSTAPACYIDKTRTVADKFKNCSSVTSCYDYHTEFSCENNACAIKSLDCKWNPLNDFGEETGLGVCVPKTEELQDCHACDNDEAGLGGCNQEICSKYSSNTTNPSCYYVERSNGGECVGINEVRCSDYKTKEDCVGNNPTTMKDYMRGFKKLSNNDYLLNEVYGVNVSVTYVSVNTHREPVSGTNKRINSSDKFSLGDCMWVPASSEYQSANDSWICIKNSDNYLPEGYNSLGDCDYDLDRFNNNNHYTVDVCKEDHKPPKTIIHWKKPDKNGGVVYSPKQLQELSYDVSDNEANNNEITTFFLIIPWGISSSVYVLVQDFLNNNFCDENTPEGYKLNKTLGVKNLTRTNNYLSFGEGPVMFNLREYICHFRANKTYPWIINTDFKDYLQNNNLGSGKYTIRYYSRDPAYNLEEIKEKNITIDAQGPIMNYFSIEPRTYEVGEDEYSTNTTINFSLTENHCPIICDFSISPEITNGFSFNSLTMKLSSGEKKSVLVPNMPDGDYNLIISCNDSLNNNIKYEQIITIEGDKSITNLKPRLHPDNIFSTRVVPISLVTRMNATCYYAIEGDAPNASKPLTPLFKRSSSCSNNNTDLKQCYCDKDVGEINDCPQVLQSDSNCYDSAKADCSPGGNYYIYSVLVNRSNIHEPQTGYAGIFVHKYYNGNNYTHNTTVNLTPNRIYTLYTGCRFNEGGHKEIQGKRSDIIRFSIDQDPPRGSLEMMNRTEWIPFQLSEPVKKVTLQFVCNDSNPSLTLKTSDGHKKAFYSGPASVSYCLGIDNPNFDNKNNKFYHKPAGCLLSEHSFDIDNNGRSTNSITINYDNDKIKQGKNVLYYRCVDKAGNPGDVRRAFLPLKNTDFAPPCAVWFANGCQVTGGPSCNKNLCGMFN